MTRLILALCVALLTLTAPAHAVGTVVLVSDTIVRVGTGNYSAHRYEWRWTSDAMGDVSTTAMAVVAGEVRSVQVHPGTGGAQPSDNYDIQLLVQGADLLSGAGADRDNVLPTFYEYPLVTLDGRQTVSVFVENAGASKQGRVVMLVVP